MPILISDSKHEKEFFKGALLACNYFQINCSNNTIAVDEFDESMIVIDEGYL